MVPFSEETDVTATIYDHEGRIIEMNERSRQVNLRPGQNLIGKNILDCYLEPACPMLTNMMEHQTKCVYTIIKGDKKKLICQIPWYENGEYTGFMELSVIIPHEMAHYVRQVPPERKA